ncbi:MAG: hypothetical protein COX29_02435 [Candidatus Moranbacteria bacterium CG23_combo_of_CG06-09_8_20_14_all_35_22]|nr:MAG: hypothetical protein COX29_02435 [Candidatus Moranbacteria bacterium CG23_combo_of_CG06-09_8_20_14_all_35_22]
MTGLRGVSKFSEKIENLFLYFIWVAFFPASPAGGFFATFLLRKEKWRRAIFFKKTKPPSYSTSPIFCKLISF